MQGEFEALLAAVEAAPLQELDALCQQMQELVAAVRPPAALLQEIGKFVNNVTERRGGISRVLGFRFCIFKGVRV